MDSPVVTAAAINSPESVRPPQFHDRNADCRLGLANILFTKYRPCVAVEKFKVGRFIIDGQQNPIGSDGKKAHPVVVIPKLQTLGTGRPRSISPEVGCIGEQRVSPANQNINPVTLRDPYRIFAAGGHWLETKQSGLPVGGAGTGKKIQRTKACAHSNESATGETSGKRIRKLRHQQIGGQNRLQVYQRSSRQKLMGKRKSSAFSRPGILAKIDSRSITNLQGNSPHTQSSWTGRLGQVHERIKNSLKFRRQIALQTE